MEAQSDYLEAEWTKNDKVLNDSNISNNFLIIESLNEKDIGSYTCTFKNKHDPALVYEATILLFNSAQGTLLPNLLENFIAEEKEEDIIEEKETSIVSIPLIQSYSLAEKFHDDLVIEFKFNFKPVMQEKDKFSIECYTRGLRKIYY